MLELIILMGICGWLTIIGFAKGWGCTNLIFAIGFCIFVVVFIMLFSGKVPRQDETGM